MSCVKSNSCAEINANLSCSEHLCFIVVPVVRLNMYVYLLFLCLCFVSVLPYFFFINFFFYFQLMITRFPVSSLVNNVVSLLIFSVKKVVLKYSSIAQ